MAACRGMVQVCRAAGGASINRGEGQEKLWIQHGREGFVRGRGGGAARGAGLSMAAAWKHAGGTSSRGGG